jgi:hypothetical protein
VTEAVALVVAVASAPTVAIAVAVAPAPTVALVVTVAPAPTVSLVRAIAPAPTVSLVMAVEGLARIAVLRAEADLRCLAGGGLRGGGSADRASARLDGGRGSDVMRHTPDVAVSGAGQAQDRNA